MRAILAGGGTGGHVIPALAIAQELRNNYNAEVLFIGTARGIENRLVPAAGFPLKLVQVGALKNVSLATRFKTLFDLPRAVLAASEMLTGFKADVVIGVGGYASGPAMLAAVLKRIPTLAFEPNVVPGFANRVVAKMVSAAAVHFAETAKYFRNAEITGVPVRQAFFEITPQLHSNPTLLVFGGSQGAHAINQAVIDSAQELLARIPGLHIVHQTGERDYDAAVAAYKNLDAGAAQTNGAAPGENDSAKSAAAAPSETGSAKSAAVAPSETGSAKSAAAAPNETGSAKSAAERREDKAHGVSRGSNAEPDSAPQGRQIEIFKFIDNMPKFFADADLLLCRSGASTVAEITAAGKPAIFVPFPRAADDHQKRNAQALGHAGAAIMLEESNLNRDSLIDAVTKLLNDPKRLQSMSQAARSLSHPNAARDIAKMAVKLAGKAAANRRR